jgi:cell division protease FtsH
MSESKTRNGLVGIVWLCAIGGLAWLFIIKPLFFGPDYNNSPYSHLVTNVQLVDEIDIESDERTIVYTLKGNSELYRTVSAGDPAYIVDKAISHGALVNAELPPQPIGWFGMLMFGVIPVLILVFFIVRLGKKNGDGILSFGKTKARLIDPEKNKTRLSDVISNPGEHDEAKEVIDFLKRPEDYRKAKAEFPKGILLAGEPGTGKTLLARAIAGEAGVPFFEVSGSEFVEMFVGVGAGRVRSLFTQAKSVAPSIIFIDEIDALGRSRGDAASGSGREQDQTLNQLLVEMDGFEDDHGVLVIAATNRPDVLDPALMRPGRFDRIINISLPDVQAREKILNLHLQKINRDVSLVDVQQIAKGTPGFSGAELKKLINEAAIFVAREQRSEVTISDLERSKDKVMMGAESPKEMKPLDLEQTAYHEAGHAIVGRLSPDHDPVYKVSIIPRGRALGVTQFLPEEERYSHSLEYLNSSICSLFGGRIAEELKYGSNKVTTGASSDIARATEIARKMVTEWGFSELGVMNFSKLDKVGSSVLSSITLGQVESQIAEILEKNYKQATRILEANRDKLDAMAAALIEHETIGEDIISQIMDEK